MDGKQQWKARGINVMYGWVRSLLSKRRILSGIPIFHISTSIMLAYFKNGYCERQERERELIYTLKSLSCTVHNNELPFKITDRVQLDQ